ncbi:MAG: phosphate ABC transporter ATP-binding protein [Anaerolineae bacterium]|nr:phosphate ABC transporter ATP-binding protein [Anaerolineae bacterium]
MTTTDAASKIRVEDVSFAYADAEALRKVSLEVYPHQVTVLFGPARAGKTTLLRLLNRLTDLLEGTRRSGRIYLDGQDIFAPEVDVAELRRRVGMVFAMPIPLPMSIRDNITYGLRLKGVRDGALLEARVESALRAAALWDEVKDRLDDPASAISGGQQQRLCLARILALEPEVILLDNPTSGLDPISTSKVEASLHDLRQRYTIVAVPHSVQQAARIADRAAFMLGGEIIEVGTAREIFTRPHDDRTRDYVEGRFG